MSQHEAVIGLAKALQARGEIWGKREADAAVSTWRTLSSAMPPNEHVRAMELWQGDQHSGLRVYTSAQIVSALRGLVRTVGAALLPSAFLESSDPTVEQLEAMLPELDRQALLGRSSVRERLKLGIFHLCETRMRLRARIALEATLGTPGVTSGTDGFSP